MADAITINEVTEKGVMLATHPKGYEFWLVPIAPRSPLKKIVVKKGGGKLPAELEGCYSDTTIALKAVRQYIDKVVHDKPKGKSPYAILEAAPVAISPDLPPEVPAPDSDGAE